MSEAAHHYLHRILEVWRSKQPAFEMLRNLESAILQADTYFKSLQICDFQTEYGQRCNEPSIKTSFGIRCCKSHAVIRDASLGKFAQSSKGDGEKTFDNFFQARDNLYQFFEVPKNFDIHNYEVQRMRDTWKVSNGTIHWVIPEDMDEGTFTSEVHGLFRKDYHTLVFAPAKTGDAGFALIMDNDKERPDERL